MAAPTYEVAQVLNRNNGGLSIVDNAWKRRTLFALSRCRTAQMGGHIDRCDHADCGRLHLSYNSCRNRHCPKCQGHKTHQWMQAREAELLDVPYFHLVFTMPDHLNELSLAEPKKVYSILFKTAWAVVRDFGANDKFIGARMGMIAILHTWGQNLSLHPHLHCIVPGGGVSKAGRWKSSKSKGKYLFPVKQMSRVFRAKFVAELRREFVLDQQFYDRLFAKSWVVFAKQQFYNPSHVVEYLGRYTHKIAISNHRIKNLNDGTVSFAVKNYRKGGKRESLTLSDKEFIRRFALHILPKGFVRIRHFGILSSRVKLALLSKIKGQLKMPILMQRAEDSLHRICPACKKGTLITLITFSNRGPPNRWGNLVNVL